MTPPIRRAATVLVLRPAPGAEVTAVEVLLVRRASRASFMANAYVFPGGAVDPADAAPPGDDPCRRAALRELAEEVHLTLPPDPLPRFARWLTPSAEPRRFDTDFFLAALPPDQAPVADDREVFDLRWLSPAAALAEAAAGALRLPPPTHASLFELDQLSRRLPAGQPPLPALLHACQGRATPRITPKLIIAAEPEPAPVIVLPWDPAFADLPGEGEPLPPPLPGLPLRYRVSATGFHPQYGGPADATTS